MAPSSQSIRSRLSVRPTSHSSSCNEAPQLGHGATGAVASSAAWRQTKEAAWRMEAAPGPGRSQGTRRADEMANQRIRIVSIKGLDGKMIQKYAFLLHAEVFLVNWKGSPGRAHRRPGQGSRGTERKVLRSRHPVGCSTQIASVAQTDSLVGAAQGRGTWGHKLRKGLSKWR